MVSASKIPLSQQHPGKFDATASAVFRGIKAIWDAIPRVVKISLSLVTGVATISGLLSTYLSFRPVIKVEPDVIRDPQQPFTQVFTLENAGPFAINSIEFICRTDNIEAYNSRSFVWFSQNDFADPTDNVQELDSGAKITHSCQVTDAPKYGDLKIGVVVRYRFFGFRKCDDFKFRGVQKVDGSYTWTHLGTHSCPAQSPNYRQRS